ncbi:uncharacterized protein N7479_002931 [Penicillium vulpinum]|uniref:Uncharacterized protein n=1 Tax=Penicillium vulpinum TaxID=29845 RepID=A0A1V6RDS9_9EURO|nr:uncharacterized protein N7479_002931 [Penicillium vulpinum]KAJ5973013.1 hypothetical protein N7479_002931 [Penicillium vulpinum]OQD99728.1 hypothetical protein PENVUL_c061G09101 [Penicillium vulpinum]
MSGQAHHLASDTDSDSESDGGMQLDDLDLDDLDRVDGIPMYDSDGGLLGDIPNVDGTPIYRSDSDGDDIWGVNGNTSNAPDQGRFSGRAQNPLTTSYNRAGPDGMTEPQTAFEKDARTRSHLRDEKHAALAVLMDSELLVTYALASRETIPQTRRRFLARYLAPNDPEKAEELYDPRFYIAPDGKGGEGSLIRGRYREVIGDINDHGWHKPAHLRMMDAKKARGGSRSVSASGAFSGANSPRRVAGEGVGTGSGRDQDQGMEDEDDEL